ncbi:MAG TPA: 2-phospho-L-lactate transferase [Solirubrobacteraceae bacterium]|nr:2-phospho-L-lactate transferase [Solirubrobacteraceae bacterium]
MSVVVLAGGTGGAKLARGMLDVAGDDLAVIANTADDVDVYGARVSPDPDLCTFWLADRIDERGWGLRDDSFNVMDGLREIGVDVWFNLGDRDLAIGIERSRRLAEGARLTETLAELGEALGLRARVLPMADEPVATRVLARGAWRPFQEFMILDRGEGPVEDVAFDGIERAAATPEVLTAIASAEAIVIGPSNPIISIRPILAVPGIEDALRAAGAPVVAVSPIVGGGVVKGPTEPFMDWAGLTLDGDGIAACYGDLLDGIVSDDEVAGLPSLRIPTLMSGPEQRRDVAAATLAFARSLG